MMGHDELEDLVNRCSYKPGWHIHVCAQRDARPYIQLRVDGTDSVTGQRTQWASGKRYLSYFMCKQEVIGAVFALIKDAELHEIHEWFRYRGASIYNPHLDPDALVDIARKKASFDMRENAMSMEEPDGRRTV